MQITEVHDVAFIKVCLKHFHNFQLKSNLQVCRQVNEVSKMNFNNLAICFHTKCEHTIYTPFVILTPSD